MSYKANYKKSKCYKIKHIIVIHFKGTRISLQFNPHPFFLAFHEDGNSSATYQDKMQNDV